MHVLIYNYKVIEVLKLIFNYDLLVECDLKLPITIIGSIVITILW